MAVVVTVLVAAALVAAAWLGRPGDTSSPATAVGGADPLVPSTARETRVEPEAAMTLGTPPPILVEALANPLDPEAGTVEATTPSGAPAACPILGASAARAPGRFPVSSSWYEGADWFRRVTEERQRAHAPMIVYFYTEWCGYCRKFERDLLADNSVDRYLRSRIVKLRVNPEQDAENESLANRFGVTGYPAVFVGTGPEDVRRIGIFTARDDDGNAVTRAPDSFVADLRGAEAAISKRYLDGAGRALQAGDPRAAIEQLDAALTLQPDDAGLFLMRAEAHLADGSMDRGLMDLRAASDLGPELGRPFSLLARYLADRSEWDESVACWDVAIDREPDGEAFAGRARSHVGRGDRIRAGVDAAMACSQGEASGCALRDELASG